MSIDQVADIEWLPAKVGSYMMVQAIVHGKHTIGFVDAEIAETSAAALDLFLRKQGLFPYPTRDSFLRRGKVPALTGPGYQVVGMGMAMSGPDEIVIPTDSGSVEYDIGPNREQLEIVRQKYPDKKVEII